MKKLLALILALAMVASLAACAGNSDKDAQKDDVNAGVENETGNENENENPDENENQNEDENLNGDENVDEGESDPEATPDEGGETGGETAGNVDAMGNEVNAELSELFVSINANITDMPGVWDIGLNAENFEMYAFVPWQDGYEAVCSEAMIGSIAHSAVLVKVPEGTDAEALAAEMQENADPRKWICVEAESVQTAVNGDLVLLVMSSQATADAMIANFEALS